MQRLAVEKPMRLISDNRSEHQNANHEPERKREHQQLKNERPSLRSENRFMGSGSLWSDGITHG